MEAIKSLLGNEYDKQPVIKASRGAETNSQELYSAILDMVISEIDSTFSGREKREMKSATKGNFRYSRTLADTSRTGTRRMEGSGSNSLAVVVGAGTSFGSNPAFAQGGAFQNGGDCRGQLPAGTPLCGRRSGFRRQYRCRKNLTIHVATQTTPRGWQFFPANRTRVGGTNGKKGADFSRGAY